MYRNTYVEINFDNLKYNVEEIIKHYPEYKYYFGVVKGNAYGHSNLIAKYLVDSGINYLVVSSLDEGIIIREDNPDVSILCVEPIDTKYIDECVKNNITITIHDINYFKELLVANLSGMLKPTYSGSISHTLLSFLSNNVQIFKLFGFFAFKCFLRYVNVLPVSIISSAITT